MEFIVEDPLGLFSFEEIKEISKIWQRKEELINEAVKLLKEASKELKLDEQTETDLWFEFIEFPFHLIKENPNKFRPLLIIKNRLNSLFSITDMDIETAQKLLRKNYDYELKLENDDQYYLDTVKGFVLNEGIKKHLSKFPEIVKANLTKGPMTHLMKIRLLKELGFFNLLKERNINTSIDIGRLLSLIINSDLDTLRKIAANIVQTESTSDKAFDPTRPDILEKLRDVLNIELPNSKII